MPPRRGWSACPRNSRSRPAPHLPSRPRTSWSCPGRFRWSCPLSLLWLNAERPEPLRAICPFRRRSETDRALRLRSLRGLDGDLAGLGLLGLRNVHFEHTVAIRRGDALRLNRVGQRERPLELAVHALRADVVGLLLLFLAPLLAANDELIVGEGDLHVLELHARKLGPDREAFGMLLDIHGGLPRHRATRVAAHAQNFLEQTVEIVLECERVPRGGPTNECHDRTLLLVLERCWFYRSGSRRSCSCRGAKQPLCQKAHGRYPADTA